MVLAAPDNDRLPARKRSIVHCKQAVYFKYRTMQVGIHEDKERSRTNHMQLPRPGELEVCAVEHPWRQVPFGFISCQTVGGGHRYFVSEQLVRAKRPRETHAQFPFKQRTLQAGGGAAWNRHHHFGLYINSNLCKIVRIAQPKHANTHTTHTRIQD